MSGDLKQITSSIIAAARHRWLQPEEIFLLLVKPKELGLPVHTTINQTPRGISFNNYYNDVSLLPHILDGDVFVLNVKNAKVDGLEWAK
jgi:hypothetical protein